MNSTLSNFILAFLTVSGILTNLGVKNVLFELSTSKKSHSTLKSKGLIAL